MTCDLYNYAGDHVYGQTEEEMQLADSRSDELTGSKLGGNIWARLMGGNDSVNLYSGMNNFVNCNAGYDFIHLRSYLSTTNTDGNILGGRDDDYILIEYGATWGYGEGNIINGNKGNDEIINHGKCPQLRGGADNDRIENRGGDCNVWGDDGADTFVPWARTMQRVDSAGVITGGDLGGLMEIMDFSASEGDTLDLTLLGGDYDKSHVDSNGDGLIDTALSAADGPICCIVYSTIL